MHFLPHLISYMFLVQFLKNPQSRIWLLTPEGKAWKYTQLIAGAPDKTLDLSDLPDAQHVVDALQIIAKKYTGYMFAFERMLLIFDALFSAAAAVVTSMNMRNSCNDLQPEHAAALQVQLGSFPALKHLDVSRNPGLKLLPVSLLHVASELETFNCIECTLSLPPRRFFSESEEDSCLLQNPRRIQALLNESPFDDKEFDLSGADLVPSQASDVAFYLRLHTNVARLDISQNPKLGCGGVAIILSALEGTSPFSLHNVRVCVHVF